MKNDFMIRGKTATLFVEAPPNVGYGSVEVKLDAKDLEIAKAWPGTWFSFVHPRNGRLYIRATAHKVAGKAVSVPGFEQKQPLLHRVIAKPDRGQNTIFKDGNSLNLTRDNLVNLPIGEVYVPVVLTGPEYADMVKGVHYRKDKQRYEVRCYHKAKYYNLGIYKDVDIANRRATDFRNLGPDGYFKKYGAWGSVTHEEDTVLPFC